MRTSETGRPLFSDGQPLTDACDGVLLMKLGKVAKDIERKRGAKVHTLGAELLAELNRRGFLVIEDQS